MRAFAVSYMERIKWSTNEVHERVNESKSASYLGLGKVSERT